MKLWCYSDGAGYSEVIECDVTLENNKLVVYFIKSQFSDANKWNETLVLTDKFVKRCEISSIYKDKNCDRMKRYIGCKFTPNLKIIEKIEEMSEKIDEVSISLPTSRHAHSRGIQTNDRMFKNTFLPLIVSINGEDVSRDFWDFDTFESNAVNVAYQALIKGEIPTSNNDLVDFYGVQKLHQQLTQDEVAPTSAKEDVLSK